MFSKAVKYTIFKIVIRNKIPYFSEAFCKMSQSIILYDILNACFFTSAVYPGRVQIETGSAGRDKDLWYMKSQGAGGGEPGKKKDKD